MNENDFSNLSLTINYLEKEIQNQQNITKEFIHKNITKLQGAIDKITTFIYKYLKEEIIAYMTNHQENVIVIHPDLNFKINDLAPKYGVSIKTQYKIFIYNKKTGFIYQVLDETLKNKVSEFNQNYPSINLTTDFIWEKEKIEVIVNNLKEKYKNEK